MGNVRNRSKLTQLRIRVGQDLKLSLDRLYNAQLHERVSKGIEGKYSMNDFLNGCLWEFVEGGNGQQLMGIYWDELHDGKVPVSNDGGLSEDDF